MTARDRATKLIKVWPRVYPDAHTELNFKTPLELLIATILSAQCTDKRVNMVTPALFKKYRSAKDYAAAPTTEIDFSGAKQKASKVQHRQSRKSSAAKFRIRWRNCASFRELGAKRQTWFSATRLEKMKGSSSTRT